MRVLLYHPTLLPPKDYGGVERVVLWLAQGLIQRGHEVYIAALPGSRLPKGCHLVEADRREYSAEQLLNLFPKKLDLVHFMAPVADDVWNRLSCPAVLTVHGNGKPGEKFPKNTVFLSRDHARRHHAKVFVYNGIDPKEYLFNPSLKEDWYLFLSKTSWRVKNLSGAIRYCKKAKVPLRITGGNRPWLKRVESFLSPSLKWIGPVSGVKKAEYLQTAKALIFPVLWPEPFGLVVAEALISGTPVIASPHGSLPELLPSHVGALPDSEEAWIEILKRPSLGWDPHECREWALKNFHFEVMAENYENIYRKIIQGDLLHEEHPISGDWRTE